NKPALMIAADLFNGNPRTPGAISNTVDQNVFWRNSWDGTSSAAVILLRLNGGTFSDASFGETVGNRYHGAITAGQAQWRETATPQSMTFAQFQDFTASGYGSFEFETGPDAAVGLPLPAPLPSGAAAYTPKFAGVF